MDGYFKLHRQIFDSWVFADDKALKIWIWIIGKARHKAGNIPLKCGKGIITVNLKVGQFIFGRHKAEDALFLDGSLIYRKMQKMQDDKMIKIESNNQYSIVTVCNYEEYQTKETESEQLTNNQRTTDEQLTNTNKKDNKDKNVNKKGAEKTPPPYQKIVDYFNNKCKSLPTVKTITDPRKTSLRLRWNNNGNAQIIKVIDTVASNKFFSGDNDRSWKANFDWVMKEGNFIKILEGNYSDATTKPKVFKHQKRY
jgi:hypothetical protein